MQLIYNKIYNKIDLGCTEPQIYIKKENAMFNPKAKYYYLLPLLRLIYIYIYIIFYIYIIYIYIIYILYILYV